MHQSEFFSAAAQRRLPTMVRGRAATLRDSAGNGYIDAGSGAVLTNLGQGNRRVIRAIKRQARRLTFTYVRNSRHHPNHELVEKLVQWNKSGFDAAYLSTDGSDAIEVAIKMARLLAVSRGEESKNHIVSLRPSYHGATLATLPLSGDPAFADFNVLGTPTTTQVDSPFAIDRTSTTNTSRSPWETSLELLSEALTRIGDSSLLALVVEPIGGVSNGAYSLPLAYLKGLRELSDRYGMWLIYDEIMAHIRTGWFLTSDRLEPEDRPDMVAIGKGLGAGYSPIAATLTTRDTREELVQASGFNLSHTYNANPISCAAAIAVLGEVERQDLLTKARHTGQRIIETVRQMQADGLPIKEVQGEGLLIAIHLEAEPEAMDVSPSETVRRLALDNGLLVYVRDTYNGLYGHWVMITPPLTITRREVDHLVVRLRKTLAQLAAELRPTANQGFLTRDPQ